MATFDTLIEILASRFGLGATARLLVSEVVAAISAPPGGLGGFLDKLKSAGLASEVASWVGHPDVDAATPSQIERALGASSVAGMASRLGLPESLVTPALGYALPKIVGLLTPGGAVPAGVPPEVTAFLSQPRVAAVTEQAAPKRIDVLPVTAENEPTIRRWLWPALAALAVVAVLSYFWSTLNRIPPAQPVANAPAPATPAPAIVAPAPPPAPAPTPKEPAAPPPAPTTVQATAPAPQSPAPAPSTDAQATAPQPTPPPAPAAPAAPPATTAQAPATPPAPAVATAEPTTPAPAATPTRFSLSNDNGAVRASGVVRDQDAKTSMTDALNAVFGADKVKSDIGVDKNATAAPWLGAFRAALDAIKGGNVDAIFQGDKVNVGGAAMTDSARDKVIAALKGVLGADVTVGALSDKTAAAVAIANDRATTELASLHSGFGVKDLLFALNDSAVNFASDSAEVPESMAPFLKTAAADLKQLKAGHVLEIAGYTDNTGDAALNLALSQKRAEAVREAFIKYGADPDMLVAKGYGDADPIASNDTPEGRLKNRRIEYHVLKAPT
ncbi:MAG TPA: OmpA family protein [Roseiarcus sp.]